MAEITKPIALDESFNTTEGSPRNIADVLAQGIGDLVTVVSRISHQTTYDELSDLEDVNISSPTNGDVLTYDGSKWTNGQGGGGASVEQMIAPVETSTTSSQAYAVGEQFILNGTLYTATAAITAGGTITIGGNCSASDSVTEQIANVANGYHKIAESSTSGTNGQKINEIATDYGNLSTAQKMIAKIKMGNDIYNNISINYGSFVRFGLNGTSNVEAKCLVMSTKKSYSYNGTTITENTTSTNTSSIELWSI